MTPEVLLVCGAAEDQEIWESITVAIPTAGVVVLPPLSDLETLRRTVSERLTSPTVLVGHSLGGAICVLAAAADPGQALGVIVAACGASLPVHPVLWDELARGDEAVVADRLARAAAPPATSTAHLSDVRARMRAMMGRARPGTLESHLRACAQFDAPSMPLPAIVIAGEADRVVAPELCRQLADRLHGRFELLPDTGHQIPWQAPHAVLQAIRDMAAQPLTATVTKENHE